MKVLSVYSGFSITPETEEIENSVSDASYPYILFITGAYNWLTKVMTPLNCVESIVSNGSICLAIISSGKVFGWGEDTEGLLGQGSQKVTKPIEVVNLSSISKLSLSQDHAAAISQSGQLYTWGSKHEGKLGDVQFEKNCPKLVPSAKQYEAISVISGNNYTAILTSGGYLMIYGQVSSNHLPQPSPRQSIQPKNFLPYSNPALDLSPILQVLGAPYYILAQLDSQELVVFDGCLNPVKFPVPDSGFDSIQVNSSHIVGITLTEIIVWTKNSMSLNKFECPVKVWKTSKYKVFDDLKIWTWGENFLVVSDNIDVFEQDHEVEEYLVVVEKSVRNSLIMESPLNHSVQSLISPQSRKESLLRLFPGNEGEKTIAKIMKCREEFSNRNLLKDVFRKIVHPIVKNAFFVVKEFAKQRKIFKIMKNAARFFCVFENLMTKKFLNKFFVWVRRVRIGRVKAQIQKKLGLVGVRNKGGNQRKMKMFCMKIKGNLDNSIRRVREDVLAVIISVMNKEKTVGYLVNRLKNIWVFQYFERWRKVYMSKLIFLKKLEEKSLFCVSNWLKTIFLLLIQEYQRKEIFVQWLPKAAEKILGLLQKKQEKSGFIRFKLLLIISKANKLKRQVLLKRLCHTLFLISSSHLHNKVQLIFFSIKSYKRPKTVLNKGQKISFTKNRVIKSQISTKPKLLPIQHLLQKSLKSYLDQLLLVSQDSFKSNFYSFLFSLNNFIIKKQFVNKLTAMTIIKISTGLLQSFNDLDNSDSNSQHLLDEISNSKTCISSSMHITLFDNSPKYKDQSLLSPGNSPRSIQSTEFPTNFHNGELLSYQKYLINKKKLEMIKEDKSFVENGKFCIEKRTRMKKSSKNSRPPWKPSSVSANFYYQPKKESAIEKGIQYYESRVQKSAKSTSIINMSKLDDSAMKLFLKFNHSSKGSQEFDNKMSFSPFLYSIDRDGPSQSVESIADVGLGVLILSKFSKLRKRKLLKSAFFNLKSSQKPKKQLKIQQKPVSSNSHPAPKNKPAFTQLTWQLRVVSIGLEKLKMFFKGKNKVFWTYFRKQLKL